MLSCSRELKKYPSSNEVFFIHFYLLRIVLTRMLPFTSPAEHLKDAQAADLGVKYHVEGGPLCQNLDAHPSGETQQGAEHVPPLLAIPGWKSLGNKLYHFSLEVQRVTALCLSPA